MKSRRIPSESIASDFDAQCAFPKRRRAEDDKLLVKPKDRPKGDPRLLSQIRRKPCLACDPGTQAGPSDVDHLRTRGAGGRDTEDNCWPLCRTHHSERHRRGIRHMAEKYPRCSEWLKAHGRYAEFC